MPSSALLAVAEYVRQHPGCSKRDVVRDLSCSYGTVTRAADGGLIRADRPSPRHPYRLYPPLPQSGGEV